MTRKDAALTTAGLMAGAALIANLLRNRRRIDFTDRVALITGGSRGLGLLIARELGLRGMHVTLVARDWAELQRAQADLRALGVDVWATVADVAAESDAHRIVDEVMTRHGRLDVLVNNAGVIAVGPLDHLSDADFEEAMGVHFWGPLHTMRAAIPHMRRQGIGRVANISSIGGKVGVPHMVPYCASKFALTGLSMAVAAELAKDDILVTTVSPGLMRTGHRREEFAWFAIADSLPLLSIDGRRAATQIVDAIRYGDAELVITWQARLMAVAAAIVPNTVAHIMGLINRVLPPTSDAMGNVRRSGRQSASRWARSPLTRVTERRAADNNELPEPLTAHPD